MAAPDVPEGRARPSGESLYLYCLARADALPAIDGLALDGGGPELVGCGAVVAVVSRVDANEFCGPPAEARMRDLAWIGPRVCRHHQVVEAAMRASPVVPARFAVLFSSPGRLREWLVAHGEAISRALDRLADHEEWAVKGTLDRRRAEDAVLRRILEREVVMSSPGARYLRERRARAALGQELDGWLSEVSAGILRELASCAVELREQEVGAADPGVPAPVFNWAFLVARKAIDQLAARVTSINAEHAERGLALALSGPWPPYSFCPVLESSV